MMTSKPLEAMEPKTIWFYTSLISIPVPFSKKSKASKEYKSTWWASKITINYLQTSENGNKISLKTILNMLNNPNPKPISKIKTLSTWKNSVQPFQWVQDANLQMDREVELSMSVKSWTWVRVIMLE